MMPRLHRLPTDLRRVHAGREPPARSVIFIRVRNQSLDPRRLLGVTFAVLALGAGVVACGGGDDETPVPATTSTTTEEEALTKADLIQQGDEICAEINAALGSIAASTADETTKSSQITDLFDGLAQQLGELGTPSDGDPPTDLIAAAQDLADGSSDTTAFTAAADEYGFTDCTEEPEAVTYSPDSSGGAATGTESGETYVPPPAETIPSVTEPAPPATAPTPPTGGGITPTPPDTGGSTGGSSGGGSSGGIGPG